MISLIQYSFFFLFIIIIIIIIIIILMGRQNKLSTLHEGTNRSAESKIITGLVGVYI